MKKIIFQDNNGNELSTKEAFKKLKEGKFIKTGLNLSEKTREIPGGALKNKWQELKNKLKEQNYSVESFQMPQILALVLIPEDFDAVIKEFVGVGSLDKEEYGEVSCPDTRTSAFLKDISGSGKTYLLFICEGRYDFNKDLEHELAHIFEDFLNLKPGELTHKLKK